MSYRNAATVTNLAFLIGGVYFVIVAALGEATVYSIFPAVLCFLSIAFSLREGLYFAGPWRVASGVAVIIVLLGQEIASLQSNIVYDGLSIGTVVLNGVLLIVFIGVLLSCAREVTKQETTEEEEEEEEGKEAARLTR